MTASIDSLVASLFTIRQQKSALEKTEKVVLDQLKPLVDPEFDMHKDLELPVGDTVIHSGSLDLTRVQGTSRSISADLLLARGVAPDIIASATKTAVYFQYRIKDTAAGGPVDR